MRKHFINGEWREWTVSAASLLKLTMILSGAATVGLVAVMPWMNRTLFTDFSGTDTLQLFVISVFFASLVYCLHTILLSTGKGTTTILYILVGLVFKSISNQLMVKSLGINGASLVTVLSLMLIVILMMQLIPKEVWKIVLSNKFLPKFVFILVGLYAVVRGLMTILEKVLVISGRFGSFFLILIGVLIGVTFFVISAFKLQLLNDEETTQIPFLSKILDKTKRK